MSAHESSSAVNCPVCGMSVDPATAQWISDYQGTKFYFCGKHCKFSFDKNPTGHIK